MNLVMASKRRKVRSRPRMCDRRDCTREMLNRMHRIQSPPSVRFITRRIHQPKLLWTPSQSRKSNALLTRFIDKINITHGTKIDALNGKNPMLELHDWSVAKPSLFWSELWDFVDINGGKKGDKVLVDSGDMMKAEFFPNGTLNFAQGLLKRKDTAPAIIFQAEDKIQRQYSFADLHEHTSRLAQAIQETGVKAGDRVAGIATNSPETVVAMLSVTSLGGVFSTCSPDFGVSGILDRFGQISPKILISTDCYYYKGVKIDCVAKAVEVARSIPSVKQLIILPFDNRLGDISTNVSNFNVNASNGFSVMAINDYVKPFHPRPIDFHPTNFNDPAFILFSSGTTGPPKCIVHRTGCLLQLAKEHMLHSDIKRDEKVFYFTTCGWMMWNWLVASLACEACVLLYEGSPFHPKPATLFDFAQAHGATFFGTSAKFLEFVKKEGVEPARTHDLSRLRAIASTGSPLSSESFEYVYDKIKADVCLSSISGGTDIMSCFVLGNPIGPVYQGEIQAKGLGMAVEVWSEEGRPVTAEKGELVCTRPFPSQPIRFWNDPGDQKYRAAYFDKFDNVWAHGDFAEVTPRGGVVIHGRSDATLNPGGVRVGTAEIYRQVDKLDEVLESLAVGAEVAGDVQVLLFVKLRAGLSLDEALTSKIKQQIRSNTSPRHVPARVHAVSDIPRTKTGKLVELAVKEVIHGRPVRNRAALANPECLDEFAQFAVTAP